MMMALCLANVAVLSTTAMAADVVKSYPLDSATIGSSTSSIDNARNSVIMAGSSNTFKTQPDETGDGDSAIVGDNQNEIKAYYVNAV